MTAPVANLAVNTVAHVIKGAKIIPASLVKFSKSGKQIFLQMDSVEPAGEKVKIRRNIRGDIVRFDWSEKTQSYGGGTVRLGEWRATL